MKRLGNAEHLFRMAVLFVAGMLLFVFVRGYLVPKSFGQYGHYRGDSIKENASLPIAYAGQAACADCHSDVLEKKGTGSHKGVKCEACHGPLQKHVADPSVAPVKPDPAKLCARCHELVASRPKTFPQVKTEDHYGGVSCETCHQPHAPKVEEEGKKK